jgi:peptidoglycan/xylan/chitin deacetylase (PgdA/CDA1 family)|tara:strand:- start:267 stop:1148 length:882 start_codon:yes stop_codon:yes gene_type:complete
MDIENWYHLDYFKGKECDQSYSMLDGLDSYLDIIDSNNIPSSFFALGELVLSIKSRLREISDSKHDLGSHGWAHKRPLNMDVDSFRKEVLKCKSELEQLLGKSITGYRAPCFSLDRERLNILKEVGYKYDSSRIEFGDHPLYGEINMNGFKEESPGIYRMDDFYEFQISTLACGGKQIPVSGGGYLRIFPWFLMNKLLKKYLTTENLYVLYIHPFEFSSKNNPIFPSSISLANKFRFSLGRGTVTKKFERVIQLLKEKGFHFTTFENLRGDLMKNKGITHEDPYHSTPSNNMT